MAAPAPRPCPYCKSTNTESFPDNSGQCYDCGRAFRGPRPVGALLVGEEIEKKKAAVRTKERLGITGLVGGVLAYLTIPLVFVLGAVLGGKPIGGYVSTVFNESTGALVCGGIALLVIAGYYAMWSGYLVYNGYRERGIHLLIAGALVALASLFAGLGVPGILGILGGLVALLGGYVVWRAVRAEDLAARALAPDAG